MGRLPSIHERSSLCNLFAAQSSPVKVAQPAHSVCRCVPGWAPQVRAMTVGRAGSASRLTVAPLNFRREAASMSVQHRQLHSTAIPTRAGFCRKRRIHPSTLSLSNACANSTGPLRFPKRMIMVRSATEAPRIFCGHIEQRFANVNWSAIVAQEHIAVSKLSQSVTGRSGFLRPLQATFSCAHCPSPSW